MDTDRRTDLESLRGKEAKYFQRQCWATKGKQSEKYHGRQQGWKITQRDGDGK